MAPELEQPQSRHKMFRMTLPPTQPLRTSLKGQTSRDALYQPRPTARSPGSASASASTWTDRGRTSTWAELNHDSHEDRHRHQSSMYAPPLTPPGSPSTDGRRYLDSTGEGIPRHGSAGSTSPKSSDSAGSEVSASTREFDFIATTGLDPFDPLDEQSHALDASPLPFAETDERDELQDRLPPLDLEPPLYQTRQTQRLVLPEQSLIQSPDTTRGTALVAAKVETTARQWDRSAARVEKFGSLKPNVSEKEGVGKYRCKRDKAEPQPGYDSDGDSFRAEHDLEAGVTLDQDGNIVKEDGLVKDELESDEDEYIVEGGKLATDDEERLHVVGRRRRKVVEYPHFMSEATPQRPRTLPIHARHSHDIIWEGSSARVPTRLTHSRPIKDTVLQQSSARPSNTRDLGPSSVNSTFIFSFPSALLKQKLRETLYSAGYRILVASICFGIVYLGIEISSTPQPSPLTERILRNCTGRANPFAGCLGEIPCHGIMEYGAAMDSGEGTGYSHYCLPEGPLDPRLHWSRAVPRNRAPIQAHLAAVFGIGNSMNGSNPTGHAIGTTKANLSLPQLLDSYISLHNREKDDNTSDSTSVRLRLEAHLLHSLYASMTHISTGTTISSCRNALATIYHIQSQFARSLSSLHSSLHRDLDGVQRSKGSKTSLAALINAVARIERFMGVVETDVLPSVAGWMLKGSGCVVEAREEILGSARLVRMLIELEKATRVGLKDDTVRLELGLEDVQGLDGNAHDRDGPEQTTKEHDDEDVQGLDEDVRSRNGSGKTTGDHGDEHEDDDWNKMKILKTIQSHLNDQLTSLDVLGSELNLRDSDSVFLPPSHQSPQSFLQNPKVNISSYRGYMAGGVVGSQWITLSHGPISNPRWDLHKSFAGQSGMNFNMDTFEQCTAWVVGWESGLKRVVRGMIG